MSTSTLALTADTVWLGETVGMLLGAGARAALLLTLVSGMGLLLRRASAATRHALWGAGLAVTLVLPLGEVLPWRWSVLPDALEQAVGGTAVLDRGTAVPGASIGVNAGAESLAPVERAGAADPELAAVDESAAASGGDGWSVEGLFVGAGSALREDADARAIVLLMIWLAGVLFVGGQLLMGHWLVGRIAGRAQPVTSRGWMAPLWESADRLDVEIDVALRRSGEVSIPFATGVVRPIIVLPDSAEEWSEPRRRAVLLHELAHVQRRDLLLHHLGRWACALYWFNPLVWLGARRLRAESERAADDLVLSAGTRPSEYADHLLQIVAGVRRTAMPAPALPLAQRREFEGRMMAILEPHLSRRGLSRLQAGLVTVLIALFALPLVALAPADPADPPGATRAAARSALVAPQDAVERSRSDQDQDQDEDRDQDRDRDMSDMKQLLTSAAAVAANALDAESFDVVLEQVQQNEAHVRVEAVRELSAANEDPRAVEALIRLLVEDAVADVRCAAARALGAMEAPQAVPALGRAVLEDESTDVRAAAAWALGQIEGAAGADALVQAIGDQNEEVRESAIWALGQIEDSRAVPALIRALDSGNAQAARKAAWALGEIEDPQAVEGLVRALSSSKDVEVRRVAAWALGEIEDARASEVLARALADADVEVRRAAVHSLGAMEDPAAVPGLIRALADRDDETRAYAAWALGEIGLERAPEPLSNALSDRSEEVRAAAAHALAEIDDPSTVPALAAALDDPSREVRQMAARALAEMDSGKAMEALVSALSDEDPEVRRRAAEAIGSQ